MSAPLQKRPSLQTEPLGSAAAQLSAASLQVSLQFASPSAPAQGVPAPPQTPAEQVSVTVQKSPSLQAEPLASAAVQVSAASLQLSAQLPSPSAPGQGVPEPPQTPLLQVSVAVQNSPSLHGEPLESGAVHVSLASLQLSAQFASPSAPGHGLPTCPLQTPPLQVSAPLQNRPSSQGVPLESALVQESEASLQDSAQLLSPSGPGQGAPTCCVQAPAAQVSAPLQNRPSSQAAVLAGC